MATTFPIIPDKFEQDLTKAGEVLLRYKDGAGMKKDVWFGYTGGTRCRIQLRPVLVIEEDAPDHVVDLTVIQEIPLEAVLSVDVDDFGAPVGDLFPIARWARDPERGLVRFVPEA